MGRGAVEGPHGTDAVGELDGVGGVEGLHGTVVVGVDGDVGGMSGAVVGAAESCDMEVTSTD